MPIPTLGQQLERYRTLAPDPTIPPQNLTADTFGNFWDISGVGNQGLMQNVQGTLQQRAKDALAGKRGKGPGDPLFEGSIKGARQLGRGQMVELPPTATETAAFDKDFFGPSAGGLAGNPFVKNANGTVVDGTPPMVTRYLQDAFRELPGRAGW